MRKNIAILLAGLLLLTFAACSKTEQANNNSATAPPSTSASPAMKTPPENIVTTSVAEAQLSPGGSVEADVQVNITSGYHINANPPSKRQIATTLNVEPGDGITAGQPQYPPSVTRKFSFSPEAIAVYEGQATIKVQLKASGDVTKGAHTLHAKVRVQPCDDQACYPPRDIETSIPVAVK